MISKPSVNPCARSKSGCDVDRLALDEGDNRFLDVRTLAARPLEDLHLALGDQRVDALHLDVEEALDRFLDLRLGGVLADPENDLVMLRAGGRLFGDDRAQDDVVVARIETHLKRASSASTAARDRTSFSRRRMS